MTRFNLIRATAVLLVLVLSAMATPTRAPAQDLGRAAIGGGLGVLGGVGLTVAKVVARAHWQNEYLNDPSDLIHWQSVSMILAPATGVVFGLHSGEAVLGSFIGSVAGMAAGSGLGALAGAVAWRTPEGPWAGGAIGGGLGLAVGGLVGGYIGWIERESRATTPPVQVELRIPLRLP